MKRCTGTLLFILLIFNIAYSQHVKFLMPLKGEPGKDFFICYYPDHDSSLHMKDVFCGAKTYNGHMGTDMLLRSFKTMDSGVNVHAVADGRIFEMHDGDFDRSKKWKGGGFGNHIGVIHSDTISVYYGHLMKNSLLVKKGDSVKAGQILGKVGSSGYSSYPHLHFEVRDKQNRPIDPFFGACHSTITDLWKDQPTYDTSVYAIDNGFVPYIPSLDTLLDRYLVGDTFYINKDTAVCFWVLMHGLQKGKNIRVEWCRPRGQLYFSFSYAWNNNWWYDYTWPAIKMPEEKGRWTAKLFVNDVLVASRHFYVAKRKRSD